MTRKTLVFVGAALMLAAFAAGLGYHYGTNHPGSASASPEAASADPRGKPLYYRNPMGLPDTSPTPKKDPMGMDYIPVYAGAAEAEANTPGQVLISAQKVQQLGVRVVAAQARALERQVRAAGRIEPDERRLFTIAPKFEGYVERLFVNVTGQTVASGQALLDAYSPELVSAQREYILAAQGVAALQDAGSQAQAGMQQLAQASLLRLKNWDISEAQIQALTSSGNPQRTLTLRSPVNGIVMEKKAVQGMRFMPGEVLFQLADLSRVWVIADVFEQDLALVKTGLQARVTIDAYPDKTFTGSVTYVYPTLKAETRTVPIRIELANPAGVIKPGMFAQVQLQVDEKRVGVSVPLSAVIDSGTRQVVLVQLKPGRFEPREVKLGARSDSDVEVLSGVQAGERVVVAANFLIDAESNLKAALAGFASTPDATAPAAGHHADGVVKELDSKAGTVSLAHGPVSSLKWPAMTMEFKLANPSLQNALKPGSRVSIEFVERAPGEWVITRAKPLAQP